MEILCRDSEIDLLQRLTSGDSQGFPSSVYLWGASGTGKSSIASRSVEAKGFSSCAQASISMGLIFRDLLGSWSKDVPRVENLVDFVSALKSLRLDPKERILFVLDSVDRLRQSEPKVLSGFLRLQELSGLNTCLLLLSQVPPHRTLGLLPWDLIPLHLPQVTKDQAMQILAASVEKALPGYSQAFYSGYGNILTSSFFALTRNVGELLRLAHEHVEAYSEPVRRGDHPSGATRALFRAFEPKLKALGENILYKEVGGEAMGIKERLRVELPFFSKFLLIAAYLASHNPSKSDKRFFVQHHGKQRKTKAMIKAKQRYSSQLSGPKAFPIDRLLAIFYAIVLDRASPSANILSQISSLVTLQYLIQISGDLDAPKYKCVVALDFIRNLSRTVNFDVVKYLYDYA
uniref:Origin recognition complex subunit 5 n=1 Tax=Caligus rogercresseyi TaxID=217165 RepID=C1BPV7_CALRO|nr:Origin recognition complex subunit 5 [Caligus rogercresseyi]